VEEKYILAKSQGINLVGIIPEMVYPVIQFTLEDILEGKIEPLVKI
jgi:hypothetical protein